MKSKRITAKKGANAAIQSKYLYSSNITKPNTGLDHTKTGRKIVSVKLCPLNWDAEYQRDIDSGIGFDIDDVNGINKNNIRSPRGIYSNYYGVDISEDSDYQSTYRCKCKDPDKGLKGKFYYDGVTRCPECGSLVERVNNTMERTGWMTLRSSLHLINPLFYNMIEKIIGKKNLNNIIFYNKERDDDGHIIINMDFYDENNPYYNIGMIKFYEKFDEILDFYREIVLASKNTPLKQDKLDLYDFLKEKRDDIFVNHIPVYTLLLRPILMIKNNMIYANINTKYQRLLANIVEMNKEDVEIDNNDLKILPLLYNSQILLNQIHRTTIEEQISGKEGTIRSNILGERVNFSSRCVITPLIGRYDLDEVKIPYLVFLELYKYEIINLLCKMDNLYINEALVKWNKAIEKFDKRIYLIMKYLIEHTQGGLYVFINRNPSLQLGSMLCARITEVKEDYDDLTMSVPLNILTLLNADFDGDVMNIISIKTAEFRDHYNKIFNPRMMLINRNDGKFNRSMNLIKDQMIGLYSFCKE